MPVVVKGGTEIPVTDAPLVGPSDQPGVLIGIYMFPWSVHVNRAPIAGKVTQVSARPARPENRSMVRALMHLMWRLPVNDEVRASVAENARNTIVIEGDLSVAMVQIADRYVRPGGLLRKSRQCGCMRPARRHDPHGIAVRRFSAKSPRSASALPARRSHPSRGNRTCAVLVAFSPQRTQRSERKKESGPRRTQPFPFRSGSVASASSVVKKTSFNREGRPFPTMPSPPDCPECRPCAPGRANP